MAVTGWQRRLGAGPDSHCELRNAAYLPQLPLLFRQLTNLQMLDHHWYHISPYFKPIQTALKHCCTLYLKEVLIRNNLSYEGPYKTLFILTLSHTCSSLTYMTRENAVTHSSVENEMRELFWPGSFQVGLSVEVGATQGQTRGLYRSLQHQTQNHFGNWCTGQEKGKNNL